MSYRVFPALFTGIVGFAALFSGQAFGQSFGPAGATMGEQESLLKVEDFSPAKGRWSINTGISYQSVDRGGYIPIILFVTGANGASIAIPSISASDDRVDKATATFGARYAVTNRLNLFGRVAASATNVRTTAAPGISRDETTADLDSLNVGVDFRFAPTPMRTHLTGFLSAAAAEKSNGAYIHGRAFSAGLTVSRVVDPLILSASVSYNHFLPRDTARGAFKPGNVIAFTPSIGFAVNPDINISWGMGFSYRMVDERAGQLDGEDGVLTTLNLGLAYRLSKDRLLNISGRAGVAGNDAALLSVGFSRRF